MATEFTMPKLGLTMEEGTILEWLVADGTEVEADQPVLIVETDKVQTEVNAPAAGRLQHVGAVGSTYLCGERIGWLLDPGEAGPGPAPAGPAPAAVATPATPPAPAVIAATVDAGGRLLASPNARRVAAALGVDLRTVPGTGPNGRIVSEDVEAAAAARPAAPAAAAAARTVATPAARNLAGQVGVDLAGVTPSGDGRIHRHDVAAHVRQALAGGAGGPAAPAEWPLTQEPERVVPLRGVRGTIATRMHTSLQAMAQLTLIMDADMDAVWDDREARKASGPPPGFTDYVVAAAAQALRAHPIVNSQVTGGGIAVLPAVHVGVAVAIDAGLVVPVVRHADRLRLDAIAAETTRLAEAARAGTLTLDDLEGGTFSVTSLGMYGVDAFTPVINPPNVAILGVGRIRDDAVFTDDGIRRVRRMTLSLTWDHRVLDGAPAAEFCRTIVGHLEDPRTLG